RAFHAHRLIKKDDEKCRQTHSEKQVATPTPEHAWTATRLKRLFWVLTRHRVTVKVSFLWHPPRRTLASVAAQPKTQPRAAVPQWAEPASRSDWLLSL